MEQHLHVNPCPPSWLSDEQKALLRGDVIEGTAYNQRWLLTSLITIWKTLQELLPTTQTEAQLPSFDSTPVKYPPVHNPSFKYDETPTFTPLRNEADTLSTPLNDGAVEDTPHSTENSKETSEEDRGLVYDCRSKARAEVAVIENGNTAQAEAPRRSVEVPVDVEDMACQLWDMCADEHVARHMLQLSDGFVLNILASTLKDPTVLRLTEIMCGMVCNLCCVPDGCEAVLRDRQLLQLLISLPERTDDSKTLIQSFMLLYRLLWYCKHSPLRVSRAGSSCGFNGAAHLDEATTAIDGDSSVGRDKASVTTTASADGGATAAADGGATAAADGGATAAAAAEGSETTNNSASAASDGDAVTATDIGDTNTTSGGSSTTGLSTASDELSTNFAIAVHNTNIEDFIAFSLQNSFSEELVERIIKVLEELLFFKDPLTNVYMAEHYANAGIVPGLLHLVSRWFEKHKDSEQQRRSTDPGEEEEDDRFTCDEEDGFTSGCLEEEEPLSSTVTVRSAFTCLNAFVDTKAADLIVSSEGLNHYLEPALVHYIGELVTTVENQLRRHKSREHQQQHVRTSSIQVANGRFSECSLQSSRLRLFAEKLSSALNLLALIKRSLNLPEVILALAKLMALLNHSGIFWEDDHEKWGLEKEGTVVEEKESSQEDECVDETDSEKRTPLSSELESKVRLTVNPSPGDQLLDTDTRVDDHQGERREFQASGSCSNKYNKEISVESQQYSTSRNPNKHKNIMDHLDMLAIGRFMTKTKKQKNKFQQKHPKYRPLRQKKVLESEVRRRSRSRRRSSLLDGDVSDLTQVHDAAEVVCLPANTMAELRDLRWAIEIYFVEILEYWFTFGDLKDEQGVLCNILKVLEQCHWHEVLLVLDAIKKLNHPLVPKVQEALLDHDAFPRIVSLLSKLYELPLLVRAASTSTQKQP